MTVRDGLFIARLRERAANAGVAVEEADLARHAAYFELLVRWNRRINLTALPLAGCPAVSLDRLFIEPLVAATYVPDSSLAWLDVGSGGGSPAIPLKIARPRARLIMTEPRARKVAFLREVVRALQMEDAEVRPTRVEGAVSAPRRSLDMVTVRGVRLAPPLLGLLKECLSVNGRIFEFGTPIPAGTQGLVEIAGSPFELAGSGSKPNQRLFLYARA